MSLKHSQTISFAVAQELRRIRQKRGLSQLAVAGMTGLSRSAIQHIEKGIRNPTLMVAHAIAASLKVNLSVVVAKVERDAKK